MFPNLLLDTGSVTPRNSYDTSQESSCQKIVCTPSSWIHHGVESYVLEDESINRVSSARLSSRNSSPQFCLKEFLSLYKRTSFSNAIDEGLQLLLPLPPLLLSRRPGLCRFCGSNGFPMHARRFDLRFNDCSNLVKHTRDIPRLAWKIRSIYYRSSFPSCAILNRNSPSTNYENSFGNSPKYSMMVRFSWALRQWNDASATAPELLDYEFSSVREFLIVKILCLCTNSSSPKNISHVRKWYCSFELFQGVHKNFWINGCPSMQKSGELSELFVTLGFPISVFLCVYTPSIRVYTRDSLSRTTSGVCTSFFPGSHLRVSRTPWVLGLLEEFCPKDTLCRETRQHAPAFTSKRKLGEELSFGSIHWNEFVTKLWILHWILSFPCNINTNEFCFRHFGFCYFGTSVSRMHVREHDLLHGKAVSRFTYSCFFLLWAAFKIVVNASGHMWSGRDVVWILVSFPLIAFFLWSFVQITQILWNSSTNLTDFCSRRHPNSHKFSFLVQSPDLHKLTWWHQKNSVEQDMILFSARAIELLGSTWWH